MVTSLFVELCNVNAKNCVNLGVYETLMTPFGPYAEGKPTKPGGFFQTAAV